MEAVNRFGFIDPNKAKWLEYARTIEIPIGSEETVAVSIRYPEPIIDNAKSLYWKGFNVFPLPYGEKASGVNWKVLQSVRLPEPGYTNRNGVDLFELAFTGYNERCNLAVMAGRTSGSLLFVDCETAEEFHRMRKEFEKRDIPVFGSISGSNKAGGHIWIRVIEGEVANKPLSTTEGQYELWGNSHYCVVPASKHPDGGTYQFLSDNPEFPPLVRITELDFLGAELRNPESEYRTLLAQAEAQLNMSLTGLNRSTLLYLVRGAKEGSRRLSLYSALCNFEEAGYSLEEAESILVPIAESTGLHEDYPEGQIESCLDSAYSDRRKRKSASKGNIPEYVKAAVWLENNAHMFSGRGGNSRREVALALIARAKVDSNSFGSFRASLREVVELSRVSKVTALKALKDLIAMEFVVVDNKQDESKKHKATRYVFHESVLECEIKPVVPPSHSIGIVSHSHPLLESEALGVSFRLFQMLEGKEPMLPKEISEETGLTVDQVKYQLKRLTAHNLVKRVKGGYIALPHTVEQLNELAQEFGVLDKTEKRKAQHQLERSIMAAHLIVDNRRYFNW